MPEKLSLRSLIKKEFVRSALIPIAVIEVLLLVLYFSINFYKDLQTRNTLLKEVQENIQEISEREQAKINFELRQISDIAKILQNDNQRILLRPDLVQKPNEKPIFKEWENGVIYKENDNGGSSIFVSAHQQKTPELWEKLEFSEAMDPLFKDFTDQNDLIVAIYINTWDNINRYYPFIPKVWEQYEPNLNIPDFNFYYLADEKHNPSRQPVWTDAYLDPAGMGWMASCIVPVYNGDFLEGVTGIDVTIARFVQNILNMKVPWDGQAFLVDESGTILAMPEGVEKLLDLKELQGHNYDNTIKKDTYKPDDFNILKNKRIPERIKELFHSKEAIQEIELKDQVYIVSQEIIPETGWHLFFLIDENIVFEPVYDLYKTGLGLGYAAIIFLIGFYIPFFVYLIRKSRKMADKISEPLNYMVVASTDITSDLENMEARLQAVGISELDELSGNFNIMTTELQNLYQEMESKIAEGINQLREKDHLIIKQSRQAAMGEMIGNIAHQWRQPLNSIGVLVQNLEDAYEFGELDEKYLNEKVLQIMNMLQYMSQTIDDFRNFFKPNKIVESFGLASVIDKSVKLIEAAYKAANIKIDIDIQTDCQVEGYPNEFSQVILNILMNSRDIVIERALKRAKVEISLELQGNKSLLKISDNAGGIDNEHFDHLFEPYYTSKEMGTGLGLYMSKMIIEKNMNGKIIAENKSDGACFTIEIPVNDTTDRKI